MKNIYIFSGLGADERAFQLLDFSSFHTTYIRWIDPMADETIESYASRIRQQITTPDPILIGLSFGGMMAIEVAKQTNTERIILIASAKTKKEIPFYYRWSGNLRMHRLMPAKLMMQSNSFTNWLFGAQSDTDKRLLKQILDDTDPIFFKWAIDKITRWKNTDELKNLFHIHGTNDRILPFRFVKCNVKVDQGGHLMTINKAVELNQILYNELYTE